MEYLIKLKPLTFRVSATVDVEDECSKMRPNHTSTVPDRKIEMFQFYFHENTVVPSSKHMADNTIFNCNLTTTWNNTICCISKGFQHHHISIPSSKRFWQFLGNYDPSLFNDNYIVIFFINISHIEHAHNYRSNDGA